MTEQSYVGLCVDQQWMGERELITAVQLHPGHRAVLAEAGIESVEREELLALMRQEITQAITRARFLGLDQLAVELLCQEALAVGAGLDVRVLWNETYRTPTLGTGEGVNHLVRVVGVALHEPFRVTLSFNDGVSRSLDLTP